MGTIHLTSPGFSFSKAGWWPNSTELCQAQIHLIAIGKSEPWLEGRVSDLRMKAADASRNGLTAMTTVEFGRQRLG
ncbi:MAG TPA: hypothetical protein VLK84_03790 [Longimicrobium sp.]|nr:hypothetical protein [Longimicrobium sp.]